MRLIDADELKEAMREHTDYKGYLVCDPEEIIDIAPTVKARPHGKWEFIGENLFMCTKCGYIADANYLEKWKAHAFDSNFPNFCPNCGADMRGEAE